MLKEDRELPRKFIGKIPEAMSCTPWFIGYKYSKHFKEYRITLNLYWLLCRFHISVV